MSCKEKSRNLVPTKQPQNTPSNIAKGRIHHMNDNVNREFRFCMDGDNIGMDIHNFYSTNGLKWCFGPANSSISNRGQWSLHYLSVSCDSFPFQSFCSHLHIQMNQLDCYNMLKFLIHRWMTKTLFIQLSRLLSVYPSPQNKRPRKTIWMYDCCYHSLSHNCSIVSQTISCEPLVLDSWLLFRQLANDNIVPNDSVIESCSPWWTIKIE
jgi:hypothetical protein